MGKIEIQVCDLCEARGPENEEFTIWYYGLVRIGDAALWEFSGYICPDCREAMRRAEQCAIDVLKAAVERLHVKVEEKP